MWERISEEVWEQQVGHVARYQMAQQLLEPGDVVLDATCGIGYGKQVLGIDSYVGIDREPVTAFQGDFRVEDLDMWEPDFNFSIGLCFETLEHLQNPQRWLNIMLKASRLAMFSVPTIPTKHFNEFHLHDFTVDQILVWLDGYEVEVIPQPEEVSHIFIVKTKASI